MTTKEFDEAIGSGVCGLATIVAFSSALWMGLSWRAGDLSTKATVWCVVGVVIGVLLFWVGWKLMGPTKP